MSELRLTIADCRAEGYCCRGVRRFCAVAGYDFRAFCRDGAPISDIEHIEDGRVQHMIRRVRENNGGK